MSSDRFKSLADLKIRHAKLVEEVGADLLVSANFDRVKEFVSQAVATGAVLEAREDRAAAHDLIGFWAAQVTTAAREHSREASKTGFRVTTEGAPKWNLGDTLLAPYNRAAFVEAMAAADEVLIHLSHEDRALARRIVLRMLRLRPGAPASDGTNFDPVPGTRGVLNDLGPDADVVRLVKALVEAGVLRVVPGENPAADRITLAATTLMNDWPTLRAWMTDRLAMRDRANKYAASRAEEAGLSPSWYARIRAQIIAWLAKLGQWSGRQIERVRGPSGASGLLNRQELADVMAYQDRNVDEQLLLNESGIREQKTSEAYRFLLGFAAIALVASLVAWSITLFSARKAWDETARAEEERGRLFASWYAKLGEQLDSNAEWRLWAGRRAVVALRSVDFDPKKDKSVRQILEKGLSPQEPSVSLKTTYRAPIRALAFSGDGRRLVTGGDDQGVQVWDTQGRKLLEVPDPEAGHTGKIRAVAFSRDGNQVASADKDNRIIVRNLDSNEFTIVPRRWGNEVVALTFSPDGKWIATVGKDGITELWDPKNDKGPPNLALQKENKASEGSPDDWMLYSLVFNTSGSRLAVVRWDGSVRLWNTETGNAVELPGADNLRDAVTEKFFAPAVAFTPDDQRLAVRAGRETWILQLEKSTTNTTFNWTADSDTRYSTGSTAFDGEGWFATATVAYDGSVRVHYLKAKSDPCTVWIPQPRDRTIATTAATLSPDGSRLAFARASEGDPAYIWVEVFDIRRIADPVAEADARELKFLPTYSQYQSILQDSAPFLAKPFEQAQDLVNERKYYRAKDEIRKGLSLPGLEPDAEQESLRLTAQLVWKRGLDLAWNQMVDDAIEALSWAGSHDSKLLEDNPDVEELAKNWAGSQLASSAQKNAFGAVGEDNDADPDLLGVAVEQFKKAKEWAPDSVRREPNDEARYIVAQALVERAIRLAQKGEVHEAIDTFERVEKYDNPKENDYFKGEEFKKDSGIHRPARDDEAYNNLCWNGSLHGKKEADQVVKYGKKAWDLAQRDPEAKDPDLGRLDTYALALAVSETGVDEAKKHFLTFANWASADIPQAMKDRRRKWFDYLEENGRFDEKELKDLLERGESYPD